MFSICVVSMIVCFAFAFSKRKLFIDAKSRKVTLSYGIGEFVLLNTYLLDEMILTEHQLIVSHKGGIVYEGWCLAVTVPSQSIIVHIATDRDEFRDTRGKFAMVAKQQFNRSFAIAAGE